jgi:hypothetical protein
MGTHETLSMTPEKKFVHHLRQVGRLPILFGRTPILLGAYDYDFWSNSNTCFDDH